MTATMMATTTKTTATTMIHTQKGIDESPLELGVIELLSGLPRRHKNGRRAGHAQWGGWREREAYSTE